MRRLSLIVVVVLALGTSLHAEKPRKPTPALPAAQYPEHDAHPQEHVTIAAEPGDTKDTEPDTRLDYFHHGFMPMRVIITNDSDKPLTLDDARIKLVTADNTMIPAATDDELQRRMFSQKSVAGTKIPMPSPIPDITIHHPPVDKQIIKDDADFGFASTTVAPHSTLAGYLYYDVREIDDPVLDHATLEVRRVHPVGVAQEFYAFEIALHPTPKPKAAVPAGPATTESGSTRKQSPPPATKPDPPEPAEKPDTRVHLIPPEDSPPDTPAPPTTTTPAPKGAA